MLACLTYCTVSSLCACAVMVDFKGQRMDRNMELGIRYYMLTPSTISHFEILKFK